MAPAEVKLPGPVRLQTMALLELVRVALKAIAAPPTVAVAAVGLRVRLGGVGGGVLPLGVVRMWVQ